ncbi:MAG TPA: restriction endonuclease [Niabella sp.]
MTWQDYEQEIFNYFREQFPKADIRTNVKIEGRFSKALRQVDILIEDYVAGNRMRIVVDGKWFGKSIDVKQVEMFIGMLSDCEANKGLLITQEGYSQAAINRAHFDPIDIELDILNFKELKKFQGLTGIPYGGGYGVLLAAPFGWIIDATRYQGILATMYQRGLTLNEAGKRKEWMYVNIWVKGNGIKSIDDFLEHQKLDAFKHQPEVKISYLPTVRRDDYPTRLRVLEDPLYPTKEYTGFIEFDDFIFFCVLFTPEELRKKNIRKLENILEKAQPLEVKESTIKNDFSMSFSDGQQVK